VKQALSAEGHDTRGPMKTDQPLIIITGAAGFIGSALAWRLNSMGRTRLLLVDHLGATTQKWKNLVPLQYHDYMEKSDFLQAVLAGELSDVNVGAVLHMGACSSTFEADASYLSTNNFEYSKRLASWCLDRAKPIRFIYASSAATYGDGTSGYVDDHERLPALRPLNMYGYSKHMFDLWNLSHSCLDQVVGLKFFNVFGPNEYHKGPMRSMVAKAYEQITETGKVQLFRSLHPDYRDGEQKRDFIYIKDAVDMALFFLNPERGGGIYNVGTGKARTWLDLISSVFRSLGREPCIDFVDMPEGLRETYQYHTAADMGKIRRAGFTAHARTLEDSVADYVPYLLEGQRPLGWSAGRE
jgi:ADP-L-glycero-D-manno-heptose 6-epimerase